MNADLGAAISAMFDARAVRNATEHKAQKDRQRAERAALKRRRDFGLAARHAAKLARKTA